MRQIICCVCFSLGVVGIPTLAEAQSVSDPTGGPAPTVVAVSRPDQVSGPEAYGGANNVYSAVANAMAPLVSDTTFNFDGSLYRFRTGGSLWLQAPVFIPSGALMTAFSIDACDTAGAAEVAGFLHRCPIGGGACSTIASVSTGVAAAPGCGLFVDSTVSTPTIDNNNFRYSISVALTGTDANTLLGAGRIHWRRQVSPAPGSNTFSDVGLGHPFHQFVEALFAAGITGGCGGGNYCPDTPVTRGQMAVFLAGALGLHWPK